MLTLAHPWILLLLPLPFLVRRLSKPYRVQRTALRIPWFRRLATYTERTPGEGAVVPRGSRGQAVLYVVAWCLVIVALARPQFLEPPIEKIIPARDLLLLVDLSGSMETEDFTNADGDKVDRLTAVKEVLDDFLLRREGDRVGLVVFGNAAFVQAPFTQDLEAVRILLDGVFARMAGPKTAFGDAIGLGITLFEESEVEERVMIALTDGNDTGSRVPPAEAARIAADHGIAIHTVAVGDPEAAEEEKLDEEALQAVSDTTGGIYYFAEDREALVGIYDELDKLETREVNTVSHRPRRDLFHWPLAAAFLLGLVYHGGRRGPAEDAEGRGKGERE